MCVCVYVHAVCVCVCVHMHAVCVHVRAVCVCVCSESMNDVIDNAKNNFGDPWTPCISLCSWASTGGKGGALAFPGSGAQSIC